MKHEDIYRAALDRWGIEAQYDQAVEECAELIAVLKHFRRAKVTEESVIDELADVSLMLGQLIYMFGPEKVERAIEVKLTKLKDLLESD
jgi:NTP pyrophosphatase (non-canonical NTP hydrolase)